MGTFQQFWAHVLGRPAPIVPTPDVVTHDPQASKPHDLDNPFFEKDVQERMGAAIAKATRKR